MFHKFHFFDTAIIVKAKLLHLGKNIPWKQVQSYHLFLLPW
jgi:hypothetical protein